MTAEILEEGLIVMARVVEVHGKTYLPIFESLEDDLAEALRKQGSL